MHLIDILNTEKKKMQWCGAGVTMASYSYDGVKYPCQTFQTNTVGDKSNSIEDINFKKIGHESKDS